MGARPLDVAVDFWKESVSLSVAATLVGIALALILLPGFREATGRDIALTALSPWAVAAAVGGGSVLLGLIVGAYPAYVLASLAPGEILSGRRTGQTHAHAMKGLLVVQFTVAIGLLAATFVMSDQLQYVTSKDLGFQADRLITVRMDELTGSYRAFRAEAESLPSIRGVTASMIGYGSVGIPAYVTDPKDEAMQAFLYPVEHDYFDVIGAEITQGTAFQESRGAEDGVIVNEAFVQSQGWDDPVGQRIRFDGPGFHSNIPNPTVIGVLENVHYQSLHNQVEPMIFARHEAVGSPGTMFVRVRDSHRLDEAIADLRGIWSSLASGPMNYAFISDELAAEYRTEQRWQTVILWGAYIALGIAAAGLIGLVNLLIRQRTKEIGIRRSLGATALGIFQLLARQPVVLVLTGALVGIPLSYVALQRWLQQFAFTGGADWSAFALALVVVLAVVGGTIFLAVTRLMQTKPVDAIRHE
jgi:putative ABC transport system permease protein